MIFQILIVMNIKYNIQFEDDVFGFIPFVKQ